MTRQVAEILAECPFCHVEGALVEQIALETVASCRMCGYATLGGVTTQAARPFYTVDDVTTALHAWARAEGVEDVHEFVRQNFLDERLDRVADRVLAKEPVPTNFDVLAWLLPGFGAGANLQTRLPILDAPPSDPVPVPGPRTDPHARRRASIAVALADGRIHPAEAALIGEIDPVELRQWRPIDVGRPDDPGATVSDLLRIARADGEVDRSELRVIAEFARAWGISFDAEAIAVGGSFERSMRGLWRSFVP